MKPHISVRGHYDNTGFVPCESEGQALDREIQQAEAEIKRLEYALDVWKKRLAALRAMEG